MGKFACLCGVAGRGGGSTAQIAVHMKILIDMNLSPDWVVSLLRRCQKHLEEGALVCLDQSTERVRILPIQRA